MKVDVLVLLFILLTACTRQTFTGVNDKLDDMTNHTEVDATGNVLFIIAQKDFRDEELETPKKILESAGYDVDVASIATDTATGKLGMTIKPDLAVKDASANDYELIVIVGGPGAPELANHQEVLDILKKAKKIGGICIAPMVLAKAGVLQGKKATVFETDESVKALEDGGAIYTGEDVTVDGSLVTANGPDAAARFGRALVELLR